MSPAFSTTREISFGSRPSARSTIETLGLHEATLTIDVALETSMLALPHSDPADRLLAASARVFDLTLVTADEKLIAAAPAIKVFANR